MGKPKSWLIQMLTGRGCECISENKLGTSESVMCDVIKKTSKKEGRDMNWERKHLKGDEK